MRKIGCLPAGLITIVLLVGGCCLHLASWPDEWLVAEVGAPIPMGNATVRVQTWTGLSGEHPYVLVVDTPQGSLKKNLWEYWGPSTAALLYRTTENWLAVLGAGYYVAFIDVEDSTGPRLIASSEAPKGDGEDWIYLEYIAPGPDGMFVLPSNRRECLNLYGAGSYPYRKSHQVEHSDQCPR